MPGKADDPKLIRCKAVNWYEPKQLLRTAVEVVVSTMFGKHSDRRLLVALTDSGSGAYDYSAEPGPFWLDYVSDTGDGFNATYTVAYHAAQPTLRVGSHDTERGRVLVFGGDQVYPTANTAAYEQRLVNPYRAAFPPLLQPPQFRAGDNGSLADAPHVFAVPGNHDWYDSLVSFTGLFCGRANFAGWVAPQSRSYFALKLPYNWWLIGTDVQLASDIDGPQAEYLRKILAQMGPKDRVVLCVAEPHWVSQEIHRDNSFAQKNLAKLETALGERVAVYLAGDLHHYRRHENAEGVQKITAGGGGAFLHATHGPNVQKLRDGNFELKKAFPDQKQSASLARRNLAFNFLNPWFGTVTGLLYGLTAFTAHPSFGEAPNAVFAAIQHTLTEPFTFFWVAALFAGFYLFTETHSRVWRFVAGTTHAAAHLSMVVLLSYGILRAEHASGMTQGDWGALAGRILLLLGMFVGGYLAGPLIMGAYLYISLNWFGHHHGEASSGMGVEDWKHFLRLKFDTDGSLTIFPIGIPRIARTFRESGRGDGTQSWFIPVDGDQPQLIENPIAIRTR